MSFKFDLKIFNALLIIGLLLSCSVEDEGLPQKVETPEAPPTPSAAVLILPKNNEICEEGQVISSTSSTVNFSWSAAYNATSYDLSVMNREGFSSKTSVTGTSKTLELERGQSYSWKVTSKNSGSSTADSSTWQFYLAGDGEQNAAPFAATAVSPTPGATVSPTDGKVTLQWEATDPDEDTLTYTLMLSTSETFEEDDTTTFADLTSDSQEVEVTEGIYYWKVVAEDESISVTSDVFSFKVE